MSILASAATATMRLKFQFGMTIPDPRA